MVNTRQELMDYATEYVIGRFKIAWRGKSWGIYKKDSSRFCYDKTINDFTYEPMPSNRDDKFFAKCRFGLVEAKKIVEKLND